MKSDVTMRFSMIHLDEVKSTNSWLLDTLTQLESPLPEGTVVYTMKQTAGRGQMGNSWESEPNKNLLFSLLLRPTFVPVAQQFVISELCSVAILRGLQKMGVADLSIKWPNDIFVGDEKLCGILIENRLMGGLLSECVLGVGININQTVWVGNAPNPTSLKLQGVETSAQTVLEVVTHQLGLLYELLRTEPEGALIVHKSFVEQLYRRSGLYPYVDAQTGESFEAELIGVDPHGPLMLKAADGVEHKYWFKEVKFVLPCGVVKE